MSALCLQCMHTSIFRASARSVRSNAWSAYRSCYSARSCSRECRPAILFATSTSAAMPTAPQDMVSEEHKPGFKKQNQEFLGTVRPSVLMPAPDRWRAKLTAGSYAPRLWHAGGKNGPPSRLWLRFLQRQQQAEEQGLCLQRPAFLHCLPCCYQVSLRPLCRKPSYPQPKALDAHEHMH